MTGFGSAEAISEPFHLNWEIKSVNNRFLDLNFRIPEELRGLEAQLRDTISAQISRGKVDCTLKVLSSQSSVDRAQLDQAVVDRLRAWQDELRAEWPDAPTLSIAELLRWPGVLKEAEHEIKALAPIVLSSFADAVVALCDARGREGGRIKLMLEQRLESIGELMGIIQPKLAGSSARYRDKLLERLARVDVQADPQRLEQELAVIAQRLDVTEEADRLLGHVAEIGDVMQRPEPIGRRLDFLIQELNREANTLASKAQDDELVRCAVELKVLIEQLREQVQNLE